MEISASFKPYFRKLWILFKVSESLASNHNHYFSLDKYLLAEQKVHKDWPVRCDSLAHVCFAQIDDKSSQL